MKNSNKKKKIIGAIAIMLILIILTIIITTNVEKNNGLNNGQYLATANANSNLVAQYIKSGITIGGITGTLEILDTSDADATAEDIKLGKTAYVNGQKITGTSTANNYKFDIFTASVDVKGNEYVSGTKTVTLPHTVAWVYIGQIANGNSGKTYINITGYSGNTITYYWATNSVNLSVNVPYAYIE